MIRLNRMTDYAVVMLVQMGRQPQRVLTAPQIAQAAALPLPTVAKVMKQLSQTHLVRSQRGATGGYLLSRPPDDITVAEIIAALEGPIALTACVDGAPAPCEVRSTCPIGGHWDKVNRAIRAALEQVTLADLANQHPACGLAAPAAQPGAVTAA